MTGYTRQSAASMIPNAEVTAGIFNAEFNLIQTAFSSSGHIHDDSAGNGPKLSLTASITGVLPVANGGFAGIHKVNGSAAPGVGDDSGDGYAVGSHWIDTTNDDLYVLSDSTLGAAVWLNILDADDIGVSVQAYDADLTTLGGLAKTDGNFIVADGAAWTVESGATARASLGLIIGTNVQAYDADLTAIAALTSAANKVPYATGAGTWALANFVTGTYTPTAANLSNVDAAVPAEAQYMQIANMVFVSGNVQVDPTTDAVNIQFTLTLPVASNIGATNHLGGTACAINSTGQFAIHGNTADLASFTGMATGISNRTYSYIYMYQVI